MGVTGRVGHDETKRRHGSPSALARTPLQHGGQYASVDAQSRSAECAECADGVAEFLQQLSIDSINQFDTIMPGHYPDRVCQHVHYLVTAPGHKPLITQLDFATDPVFEGDPDKNFSKDPLIESRELVRPITIAGDPKAMYAAVSFELCLERR